MNDDEQRRAHTGNFLHKTKFVSWIIVRSTLELHNYGNFRLDGQFPNCIKEFSQEQNLTKTRIDMESVGNSNDVILICHSAKTYSKFTGLLWLQYFISSFEVGKKVLFNLVSLVSRRPSNHIFSVAVVEPTADLSQNLQNNNFKMLK